MNNLSLKSILHVGQQLYIPKGTKRAVESIAYLQPSTIPIKESLVNSTRAINPFLTYLAYFSFEAKRDGTLKEPTETAKIANIATQGNTIPMLVITNIENGNFSADLTSVILRDATIKTNLLQTFCKQLRSTVCEIFILISRAWHLKIAKRIIVLRNVKTRLPNGNTKYNTCTENKFKSKKIFSKLMIIKHKVKLLISSSL